MASRTAFVGFKQVDGFFTVQNAESEYRAYLAHLDACGVAYHTEESGDDSCVIFAVETCLCGKESEVVENVT